MHFFSVSAMRVILLLVSFFVTIIQIITNNKVCEYLLNCYHAFRCLESEISLLTVKVRVIYGYRFFFLIMAVLNYPIRWKVVIVIHRLFDHN